MDNSKIIKLATPAVLLVIVIIFVVSSCVVKVPAGEVGVSIYQFGKNKGVSPDVLTTGIYIRMIGQDIVNFPTYTQNYVWTQDSTEGSRNDESIVFQSIEGLSVNANVGISYHVEADKANLIYEKYRRPIEDITNLYMRNITRDAFVTIASGLTIDTLYGAGKPKLVEDVKKRVVEQLGGIGIVVEKIYLIGALDLPEQVVTAINDKIQATQRAVQRQNEVAEATAEAEKQIEKARGIAESTRIQAQAEAEAIQLRGVSLNRYPSVIELEKINKWDGILPKVSGGGTSIIDLRE